MIYRLVSDGPANQAEYLSGTTTDEYGRIRAGDVIVGANGNDVTTLEELFYYLEKYSIPFEPVLLSVDGHYGDTPIYGAVTNGPDNNRMGPPPTGEQQ